MGEIWQQVIRPRGDKFIAVVPARFHYNSFSANCASAFDIERRIADHPNIAGVDLLPDMQFRFDLGPACDIVTIVQPIGKAAKWEMIPQALSTRQSPRFYYWSSCE